MEFLGFQRSVCTLTEEELTDWSGDVYYRFASDSSFVTWFTDVLWCVEMWYLASLLWKKGMTWEQDRARMYGIGTTIVIGFAAFWGFIHHCYCYDDKEACFLQTWGSVSVSCMSSGAMAILSGVYMLTQNKVNIITMILEICLLLGFTYIGMLNYFEMRPFIIVGLFGNVFPQIFLFICLGVLYLARRSFGITVEGKIVVNYLVGFSIHMLGVAISLKYSGPCGNTCPIDCVLPVPHVNHNGLMHVTEMLGAVPIALATAKVHDALDKKNVGKLKKV